MTLYGVVQAVVQFLSILSDHVSAPLQEKITNINNSTNMTKTNLER